MKDRADVTRFLFLLPSSSPSLLDSRCQKKVRGTYYYIDPPVILGKKTRPSHQARPTLGRKTTRGFGSRLEQIGPRLVCFDFVFFSEGKGKEIHGLAWILEMIEGWMARGKGGRKCQRSHQEKTRRDQRERKRRKKTHSPEIFWTELRCELYHWR